MFKFETIVGIVIAVSAMNLHAADDKDGQKCGLEFKAQEAREAAYEAAEADPKISDEKKAKLKEAYEKAEKKYATCVSANVGGLGDCSTAKERKEAQEKFDKSVSDFGKACSAGGFTRRSDSQNFECTEALNKCLLCGSKSAATDNPKVCGSTGSVDDTSSSGGDNLAVNVSRIKRQAGLCPGIAGKGLKEYEKKYDEARKEVKDLEKKLPEQQKKITDAMNKGEDEASQAQDKMTKAQQQLDQELGEAEEKYRQAKKEVAAQIVQKQQEIAQVDNQIRQVVLTKGDAEVQFNEAITTIELNCYQQGSSMVAKLQAERAARPNNRGNFLAMAKNIGLSDRENWQRIADKYYRYCMAARPTRESKKNAKAKYDSALKKADAELQKLNEQHNLLVQAQLNLKNGVCNLQDTSPDLTGTQPEDSESCSAAKKALADSERAKRKHNMEANKAASDVMKAQRKAQNEAGAAAMEAAQTNRAIGDEKQRMKDFKRAAEIADEATDNAPDPKSYDNAMEKFSAFEEAGRKLKSCDGACTGEYKDKCEKFNTYLKASGTAASADPVTTGFTVSGKDKSGPRTPASGVGDDDREKPGAK